MSPTGQTARPNHRRTPRIMARIAINLVVDRNPPVPATTININRHGGLVVSPVAVQSQAQLWIQNQRTGAWAKAYVVRLHPSPPSGGYEFGVEFLGTGETCWGDEYDQAIRPAG